MKKNIKNLKYSFFVFKGLYNILGFIFSAFLMFIGFFVLCHVLFRSQELLASDVSNFIIPSLASLVIKIITITAGNGFKSSNIGYISTFALCINLIGLKGVCVFLKYFKKSNFKHDILYVYLNFWRKNENRENKKNGFR